MTFGNDITHILIKSSALLVREWRIVQCFSTGLLSGPTITQITIKFVKFNVKLCFCSQSVVE